MLGSAMTEMKMPGSLMTYEDARKCEDRDENARECDDRDKDTRKCDDSGEDARECDIIDEDARDCRGDLLRTILHVTLKHLNVF